MKPFVLLLLLQGSLFGMEAVYQEAKKAAADPLFTQVGEYELESPEGEKFVAQLTSVGGELVAAVAEGGRGDVFKKGTGWVVLRPSSMNPPTWNWQGWRWLCRMAK